MSARSGQHLRPVPIGKTSAPLSASDRVVVADHSGESFIFTVHAVYLPRPRIEISGSQGVQATSDWQAARDSVVGRMAAFFSTLVRRA